MEMIVDPNALMKDLNKGREDSSEFEIEIEKTVE